MHQLNEYYKVDILTLGRSLQPTLLFIPQLIRYATPEEFNQYAQLAKQLGFTNVASGPFSTVFLSSR